MATTLQDLQNSVGAIPNKYGIKEGDIIIPTAVPGTALYKAEDIGRDRLIRGITSAMVYSGGKFSPLAGVPQLEVSQAWKGDYSADERNYAKIQSFINSLAQQGKNIQYYGGDIFNEMGTDIGKITAQTRAYGENGVAGPLAMGQNAGSMLFQQPTQTPEQLATTATGREQLRAANPEAFNQAGGVTFGGTTGFTQNPAQPVQPVQPAAQPVQPAPADQAGWVHVHNVKSGEDRSIPASILEAYTKGGWIQVGGTGSTVPGATAQQGAMATGGQYATVTRGNERMLVLPADLSYWQTQGWQSATDTTDASGGSAGGGTAGATPQVSQTPGMNEITNLQNQILAAQKSLPSKQNVLAEVLKARGLDKLAADIEALGQTELTQEKTLYELPKAMQEKTAPYLVNQTQLNRLTAKEREPIASALYFLQKSMSLKQNQLTQEKDTAQKEADAAWEDKNRTLANLTQALQFAVQNKQIAAADAEALLKQTVKPVEVSPGATLVDPTTGKPIYTAPTAKQQSQTTPAQKPSPTGTKPVQPTDTSINKLLINYPADFKAYIKSIVPNVTFKIDANSVAEQYQQFLAMGNPLKTKALNFGDL